MRDDMSKVIVERPRLGRKNATKKKRGLKQRARSADPESLPSREPVRPRKAGGWTVRKQLNENLAPLYRFLYASVGRPWAKVYGEIRAHLRADSAVQLHVLEHVASFVSKRVRIDDATGRPLYLAPQRFGGGWQPMLSDPGTRGWLYVHPIDGLLKRAPDGPSRHRAPVRAAANGVRPVHGQGWFRAYLRDRDALYALVEGTWYRCEFRPIPDGYRWGTLPPAGSDEVPFVPGDPFDVIIGRVATCRGWPPEFEVPRDQYCYRIAQLGKTTLRRLRLENERESK